MEHHRGKNSDSNGVNVGVRSKKCPTGKNNDPKKSLEDTNRNLTILSSKDIVLNDIGLIQSCEDTLTELSLNGPTKLLNGIENVHIAGNNCSTNNVHIDNSSHFENCVESSECPKDLEINVVDVENHETVHLKSQGDIASTAACKTDGTVSGVSSKVVNVTSAESPGDEVSKSGETSACLECTTDKKTKDDDQGEVMYVSYESELQMPDIMRLIQKDLSEPYSIYTYRYFIHNWPQLCFLAMDKTTCVGAIVCKLDMHRKVVKRGYIAMLAVDEKYRKRKIGSNLVLKAIRAMVADGADEVVLETEITNKPALRLYENLGFVRDKRLFRYYLNGVDALRLKLWLR